MLATTQNWWWPYVMIAVAGWIATDMWRWIGVFASGKMSETSQIFIWVRAVATALIAGIIARLILFPSGELAETPMWLRILAAAWGAFSYKVAREHLMVGIVSAEVVLISGWFILL
ncbi:AzlD domain-containing protein [Rhodobacteraceae bacterium RKSG542]|uniref:AzlD domain-containing protein n=1 Tax=Pseudovibrio flavus TaxID=2529854 RepID=UPI0012BB9658|nr:AzlD domain-containing protein [Pseudovibrio flavus]MTI16394.1 AzlD domain-containing protein [Pseudovibrio flavus]